MGKLDWPLEGIDVEGIEGIIAHSSQLFLPITLGNCCMMITINITGVK